MSLIAIAANFGVPLVSGKCTRVPAVPMVHIGRVDAKIGPLVCGWARLPLFTCFAVEKLAAFHFTLFANRSPPSRLASKLVRPFQFSGSRGTPAHTYSMFKFRTVASCPILGLSLLIFYHVHCNLCSTLVTVVRVSHPHNSKPAGRALKTLSILHSLIAVWSCYCLTLTVALLYKSSHRLHHGSSVLILPPSVIWRSNVDTTHGADGQGCSNGSPKNPVNQRLPF